MAGARVSIPFMLISVFLVIEYFCKQENENTKQILLLHLDCNRILKTQHSQTTGKNQILVLILSELRVFSLCIFQMFTNVPVLPLVTAEITNLADWLQPAEVGKFCDQSLDTGEHPRGGPLLSVHARQDGYVWGVPGRETLTDLRSLPLPSWVLFWVGWVLPRVIPILAFVSLGFAPKLCSFVCPTFCAKEKCHLSSIVNRNERKSELLGGKVPFRTRVWTCLLGRSRSHCSNLVLTSSQTWKNHDTCFKAEQCTAVMLSMGSSPLTKYLVGKRAKSCWSLPTMPTSQDLESGVLAKHLQIPVTWGGGGCLQKKFLDLPRPNILYPRSISVNKNK